MTKEQKDLLFRDLCSRLPYKTIVRINNGKHLEDVELKPYILADIDKFEPVPYLRPMSSMTEEEIKEHNKQICKDDEYLRKTFEIPYACTVGLYELDWLNTYHFDYRDLIGQGLALLAPEGMYAP